MDYKKELIKRVKFLLENDVFFIENVDKQNRLKMYMKLEQKDNELLQDLEYFLLGDSEIEKSPLYKKVLLRKNDKKYLISLKSNIDNAMDYFTILSLVRKFIIRQKCDDDIIINKLKAIDEYFRITRYQNNEFTYTSGAILIPSDIGNGINIRSGVISSGIIDDKKVNYSKVCHSNFVEYLSNIKNYHKDNLSVLTENEKQQIYLSIHDEIPWNTKNICGKSDLFFSDNYCGEEFSLNEDEIFYYSEKYYMMCPRCYNLSIINEEKIPDKVKERIKLKSGNDKYFLRTIFYKRESLIDEKNKRLIKKK